MKKSGRDARGMDRHGGIGNGERDMAGPACRRRVHGLRRRSDRHRRCRHGWRRRLHQPRLSGQGHSLRLFDPVALDRWRPGRIVRGVFLQRAWRDVSALQRRIQFPRPRLSPGFRISRGLGFGHGRFRGTGGAGRDGLRRVRQIAGSRRAAAGACDRRRLAGLDRAVERGQALQHLSTDLDRPQSRADRGVPDRGICRRHAAAGLVHARCRRFRRMSPARRSPSASCS